MFDVVVKYSSRLRAEKARELFKEIDPNLYMYSFGGISVDKICFFCIRHSEKNVFENIIKQTGGSVFVLCKP